MDDATRQKLIDLNRGFYASPLADTFDATRRRAWAGWSRLLLEAPELRARRRLADLGCGNGRFAAFAHAELRGAFDYVGIDASRALLARAQRVADAVAAETSIRLVYADLFTAEPEWLDAVSDRDWIVAFGVMHHVPGRVARERLLSDVLAAAPAGAFVAISLWRFLEFPRFVRRIQDPDCIALGRTALEPGDALLPWGQPLAPVSSRLRYCHSFDEDEVNSLIDLCVQHGCSLHTRFRADGREGSLNEYLLVQKSA